MIGWLIYQKVDAIQNRSYIDWFIEEAQQQHVELKLIYREDLTIGLNNHKPVVRIAAGKDTLPDFVVNRSIEPIIQHFFTSWNIPIFNPVDTAKIVNDKALTHLELSKLNIPMLPTFFIQGHALTENAPLDYPFIIKSVTGRGGKEVCLLESEKNWQTFKRECKNQSYIAQPTNVQKGKDLRVFVIGKEIVAAVLRHNETDFRANFKLGGKAIPYQLSENEIKLINKIIGHFQFGLVGIDFLLDHDGNLLFNEIEDVVGSRILSETSDINLLAEYVTFIKKTIHKKEEAT